MCIRDSTTGFSKKEENLIKKFSRKIPILKAGNMSLGINLLMYLTEIASKSLGNKFLSKVYEVHHKHKIDYPSGTALMLGKGIADGKKKNFYSLIERGQDAIQGILDVAKEGQHPRAYEVAGALIKNVADTVDKLQDLQGKLQKLKDVPNKTTANIKNALFVGSTTELQKMLNKEKTTSEKMQDELEPIVVEPEKKDDK